MNSFDKCTEQFNESMVKTKGKQIILYSHSDEFFPGKSLTRKALFTGVSINSEAGGRYY